MEAGRQSHGAVALVIVPWSVVWMTLAQHPVRIPDTLLDEEDGEATAGDGDDTLDAALELDGLLGEDGDDGLGEGGTIGDDTEGTGELDGTLDDDGLLGEVALGAATGEALDELLSGERADDGELGAAGAADGLLGDETDGLLGELGGVMSAGDDGELLGEESGLLGDESDGATNWLLGDEEDDDGLGTLDDDTLTGETETDEEEDENAPAPTQQIRLASKSGNPR